MEIKEKYAKEGLIYNRLDTYLQIPQILFCYEELNAVDIMVYSVIYQFCKHYSANESVAGQSCSINNEMLSDRANCGLTALKDSLKKLSELKIIEIKKSGSKYRSITLNVDYLNKKYNTKKSKEELEACLPKVVESYQEYKEKLISQSVVPYIKVPDSMRIYKGITLFDEILYGLLYQHMNMLKGKIGNVSILSIQGKYSVSKITEKLNCSKSTVYISLKKMSDMGVIQFEKNSVITLKRDFFNSQPEWDSLLDLKDNNADTDTNVNNASLEKSNGHQNKEENVDEIIESFEFDNEQFFRL